MAGGLARQQRTQGGVDLRRALLHHEVAGIAERGQLRARDALGQLARRAVGCFMVSTAVVKARAERGARALLEAVVDGLDQQFEKRLRRAVADGELAPDRDLRGLALVATALSHSLAVHARAGASRRTLQRLARTGVDALCR